MVDILHKVGIKSSPDDVYAALTTIEGLAGWWTDDTHGDGRRRRSAPVPLRAGGFDMKVIELDPGKRVLWEVVDGPEEWIGTHVIWDLKQDGDYTTSCSSTRAGGNRWSSCTTAAPNGRSS